MHTYINTNMGVNTDLCNLAQLYGTDKVSHGYTKYYAIFIPEKWCLWAENCCFSVLFERNGVLLDFVIKGSFTNV